MENGTPPPTIKENQTVPPDVPPQAEPLPPSPSTSSGKKKRLGLAAVVLIVVALLLGGSAAAYFGIILPNTKPENVLKKAFANTVSQRKDKFSGKLSFENLDPAASVKAVNLDFEGQSDMDKNAYQVVAEMTASGVKVPFELRGIDKSLFFKIGDLKGIKSAVQLNAPEYAPLIDVVNDKVADRWMEVDETLLKQVGAECILDASALAFTEEDMKLLERRYDEVPFATVKNKSNDTVNGRSATKFELEIDDNKTTEFGKGLEELSVVKKLKDCTAGGEALNTDELADGGKTAMTIWVEKGSKLITKVASQSSKEDEEKSKTRASFEMTIEYGEANINKPDNARPLTEVMGELYSTLLQGGGATSPTAPSPLGELQL